MHWKSESRLDNLAFSVALRAADGYELCGASTLDELPGLTLGPGTGWIDYAIPQLPFLPGSYHISAAIMHARSGHVFDLSPSIAEFDVAPRSGSPIESGCISLGAQWRPSGALR